MFSLAQRHGLGSLPAEGKAEQVNDVETLLPNTWKVIVTDWSEVVLDIKVVKRESGARFELGASTLQVWRTNH